MRPLKFECDRFQGEQPQVEGVGQGLEDGLLGVLGSLGQGDTMPACADDLTFAWSEILTKTNQILGILFYVKTECFFIEIYSIFTNVFNKCILWGEGGEVKQNP